MCRSACGTGRAWGRAGGRAGGDTGAVPRVGCHPRGAHPQCTPSTHHEHLTGQGVDQVGDGGAWLRLAVGLIVRWLPGHRRRVHCLATGRQPGEREAVPFRGEGPRAKGETARGFPGTLSQRMPRLGCADGGCRLGRGQNRAAGMPGAVMPVAACHPLQPTSLPAQRDPGRCGRLVLPTPPPGRAGCQPVPWDPRHGTSEHSSKSHVPPATSQPRWPQSPR